MKILENAIYKLEWDHGRDLAGFIVKILPEKWMILNYLRPDLSVDGFYLVPNEVIKKVTSIGATDLRSRLKNAKNLKAEDPHIDSIVLKEVVEQIANSWGIVGIYNKKNGYDDLDVGLIRGVKGNSLIYGYVGIDGAVQTNDSQVRFEDILVLTFGGIYESNLAEIIAYDRKGK